MQFGVPELEDLGDVDGKSVLLRADFNVPVRDGRITDDPFSCITAPLVMFFNITSRCIGLNLQQISRRCS